MQEQAHATPCRIDHLAISQVHQTGRLGQICRFGRLVSVRGNDFPARGVHEGRRSTRRLGDDRSTLLCHRTRQIMRILFDVAFHCLGLAGHRRDPVHLGPDLLEQTPLDLAAAH